MGKGKIIFVIFIIFIAVISIYVISQFLKPSCGTPFTIRNSETGNCELYVGCSLPKGVVEDLTCRDILKKQIDGFTEYDYSSDLSKCMALPVSEDAKEGFTCITNISVTSGNLSFCEKIKEYANNNYTYANYYLCKKNTKEKYYAINNFSSEKIYGLKCNDSIELANGGPISEDKSLSYSYPGARAFAHQGDPPCDGVNYYAFYENNSDICNYISDEKSRALCLGSSVKTLNEVDVCSNFEENNKDFCLINIVYKDFQLNNISSKTDSQNICNNIKNATLNDLCFSMVAIAFNDSSICDLTREKSNICLNRLASNSFDATNLPHWTYNPMNYYYP